MEKIDKPLYDAVLAAVAQVLDRHSVPGREQILREVGRELTEYLDSHPGAPGDLNHQRAFIDELTRLRSRSSLMEDGTRAFHLARRYYLPLSVLKLDIDSFNAVNRTWGQLTGDAALRRVADVCQKSVRKMDVTGRAGGDEFVIVLPNTALPGALDLAERLRRKIECLKIQAENGSFINLTVSIGIASIDDASSGFEQMLSCADSALFQARKSGGNRVLAAS